MNPVVAALFALLLIGFVIIEARADTSAVCTPNPPNTAVLINESACTCVSGEPQMSVTIHVPVVQTNNAIYRMVQNLSSDLKGHPVMIAAGTIPVSTPCDGSQKAIINGVTYYPIDRTLVTFSGNNRPPLLWAQCI